MKEVVSDRRPAIFVDLDGCIVIHNYHPDRVHDTFIQNSIEKLLYWKNNGYYIILTTGRKKKLIKDVLKELKTDYNFCFDAILTDLPLGKRILINDTSSSGEIKAFSFSVERNKGIGNISL